MTAELANDTWSGQVTLADGSTHAFTTVAADGDAQGGAGIYMVDDPAATEEGIWAAWVVDNDGNERGAWWQRSSFIQTQPISTSRFAVSKAIVGERSDQHERRSRNRPLTARPTLVWRDMTTREFVGPSDTTR